MQGRIVVEACVTSLDEACAAERLGAQRLELCVDLAVGGLTPPPGLLADVVEAVDIPVFGIVRDRAGDFRYSQREAGAMMNSAGRLASEGAAGLVWGGLGADGLPHGPQLSQVLEVAGSLPVTFHKAFDEVPPAARLQAAAQLAEAGVTRILTGGGPGRAIDNVDAIAALEKATRERLTVLMGGSVRADHVLELVARTGCGEVHARFSGVAGIMDALA